MFLGLTSLLVSLIIGIHFFFDFVLPNNSQMYFLAKDFVTNFVLFLVIPFAMVLKNDNMKNYILNNISKTKFFGILHNLSTSSFSLLNHRHNSVSPLPSCQDDLNKNDDGQRILYFWYSDEIFIQFGRINSIVFR